MFLAGSSSPFLYGYKFNGEGNFGVQHSAFTTNSEIDINIVYRTSQTELRLKTKPKPVLILMALTETTEYDKIEVVGIYKHVQVRKATVIKKDGNELTRSFERYVLEAGTLDASDNLVDTDLSGEPAEVSAICNAVWTTDVKAAWKANLIADKPTS